MNRSSGFTLVELVLTIIIVGIIAIYALPRMNPNAFDARVAAQDLVEAIRYTQQQSMAHSGTAHFEITVGGSGFTVTQNGANITNPLTGANSYTQVWNGVAITSGTGTITFDSRGRPDTSATINVNNTVTVLVEPFTGYAHIP